MFILRFVGNHVKENKNRDNVNDKRIASPRSNHVEICKRGYN
jgi:hypothetical protein